MGLKKTGGVAVCSAGYEITIQSGRDRIGWQVRSRGCSGIVVTLQSEKRGGRFYL